MDYGLESMMDYLMMDITQSEIPCKGDIVVALNVAGITENPDAALKNIAGAVNTGGLLSINSQITPPEFFKVNSGLYLKKS